MRKCSKCNFIYDDKTKFCTNCGEEVVVTIDDKKKDVFNILSIISLILFVIIILANIIIYPLNLTGDESSGMYWFFLVLIPSLILYFPIIIFLIVSIVSYFINIKNNIVRKKRRVFTIINIIQLILMIITLVLSCSYVFTNRPKEEIVSFNYYYGSSGYSMEFYGNKSGENFVINFNEKIGGEENLKLFEISEKKFNDLLKKTKINDCKLHTYKYQCGDNDGCSYNSFKVYFSNNDSVCYRVNSNVKSFFSGLVELQITDDDHFKNYDLNHNELMEDINAIKNGKSIVNAKSISNDDNGSFIYKGDGYIIKVIYGGEIIEYEAYSNDELIWEYTVLVPQTSVSDEEKLGCNYEVKLNESNYSWIGTADKSYLIDFNSDCKEINVFVGKSIQLNFKRNDFKLGKDVYENYDANIYVNNNLVGSNLFKYSQTQDFNDSVKGNTFSVYEFNNLYFFTNYQAAQCGGANTLIVDSNGKILKTIKSFTYTFNSNSTFIVHDFGSCPEVMYDGKDIIYKIEDNEIKEIHN